MWTNEYSAVTPLPLKAVWRALRGLHEGTISYPGADHFELHGPFAVGTEVSVTPEGQETFQSQIVDLVENRTYADQTSYGDVILLFRHTLEPLEDATRVTNAREMSGFGLCPERVRSCSGAVTLSEIGWCGWPDVIGVLGVACRDGVEAPGRRPGV